MSEVHELLGGRGRVAAIAEEMRTPYKTVWEWKSVGTIPDWRRRDVLHAANRLEIQMSPALIAYLAAAA